MTPNATSAHVCQGYSNRDFTVDGSQDPMESAFEWFKRAAEQVVRGDEVEGPRLSLIIRKSLHQVARCHRLGVGTPVDFPKALEAGRLAFAKRRASDEEILERIDREWVDGPGSDSGSDSESDFESDLEGDSDLESLGAGERGFETGEEADHYKKMHQMLKEGR